jgi:hypothetical protein
LRKLECKNVDSREQDRVNDERRGVEENEVGIPKSEEEGSSAQKEEFDEEIVCGKRHPEIQNDPGGCGQEAGKQILGMDQALHHVFLGPG